MTTLLRFIIVPLSTVLGAAVGWAWERVAHGKMPRTVDFS